MTKSYTNFEKMLGRIFSSLGRLMSLPLISDEEKMSLLAEIVDVMDKHSLRWSNPNLD